MHFTGRSPRSISTDNQRSFGSLRSSGRILTIGRWRSWEPISTPCPRTSRSSLRRSSQKNTLSGKPPSETVYRASDRRLSTGHPFCRAFTPPNCPMEKFAITHRNLREVRRRGCPAPSNRFRPHHPSERQTRPTSLYPPRARRYRYPSRSCVICSGNMDRACRPTGSTPLAVGTSTFDRVDPV